MANIIETGSRSGYSPHQQARSNEIQTNFSRRVDEKVERYGVITDAKQSIDQKTNRIAVLVAIRFDDKLDDIKRGSYTNYFFLEHTMREIATIYGDLDDLVGNRVKVTSVGNAPDQGMARIVSGTNQGNLNNASKINAFSTILAPAGGGF